MNSSALPITKNHILICEAFKQILQAPPAQMDEKLGSQARLDIAACLTKWLSEDQLNAATIAKHIAEFCEKPGHEALEEWFLDSYNSLNKDGIANIVRKKLDPGEEADAPPEVNAERLANEGRDICQYLQGWAAEFPSSSNQGNQNESKSN